ncbi:hypothetical protein AN644_00230 [Candidatus Epulonipiscium fishelsonii]|nr:hypothetical protein AN644_00230 [Epulopiscium sp. SCG-C06WGA-EpuloA1]
MDNKLYEKIIDNFMRDCRHLKTRTALVRALYTMEMKLLFEYDKEAFEARLAKKEEISFWFPKDCK